MRLNRRFFTLLAVLMLCMSFLTITASAEANPPKDDVIIYTADPTEPKPTDAAPKPTTPKPTTPPETEPPATTAPTTPTVKPVEPFTEGNAIAKDLQFHADTNKQFITIETRMQLVIAEKPSVAQSLSRILGVTTRKDGYLEGNGFLVSWCFGHLAGLADASVYDERYAKWKREDLPILPCPFRFEIFPDKRDQFSVLKELMNREDVTEVINACDAGREGELIFRSVYYLADCQKPMKRLWISSMEDEAIRDGFQNLRPGSDFDGLYKSALCRAKADWLVGINATRYFSLLYGTKLNVGRVMSPTLSLLVQRESEISAFVPEDFFTVNLDFPDFTVSSKKFPDRTEAQQLAKKCQNQNAVVSDIRHSDKEEKAPALYDLTTLQRDANRLLGYTAQQTLDYLQSLYEKKLCTYPRTDSRYLTDDMLGSIPAIVLCAAGICGLDSPSDILAQQVCNSKKVSDHHAILPTMASGEQDLSTLPTAEQNILKLISRQVLMAVSGAYRYREAEISITCGETFKTTMKMLLDAGWKKYSQKSIPQKWFSGLEVGQILTPSKVSVKDGKTQPPKHFTEDLLLSSMETAGAKDMPEDAERKGLGTPATRAGILEKLVSTGMLERRKVKKQTILVPTALGNSLITVLPEQLQSPLLTAEWENRLSQVQKGELEPEEFLDGIRGMLTDLVKDYRPVSSADILFPSAENTVGKCPRCGRPVIERSKGYFCTGQDCKFVLWRDSRFFTLKQKTLDRKTAQLLLEAGRAPLKGCVSSKTGKVYDAAVVLEDDGDRARFKLVFGNG